MARDLEGVTEVECEACGTSRVLDRWGRVAFDCDCQLTLFPMNAHELAALDRVRSRLLHDLRRRRANDRLH